MLLTYADEEYYATRYRQGMDTMINGPAFEFYARIATKEIRARTYGNIREDMPLPEAVRMCCCEVAEKLYNVDKSKSDNGLVLQSYSNDGDSGTFQVADVTASGVAASIDGIVRSWLLDSGLMYCGVKRR